MQDKGDELREKLRKIPSIEEILESIFKMLARRGRFLQEDNKARTGSRKNERNKEGSLKNRHKAEDHVIAD